MSHAFYRKWRPRTFHQLVGQEHVTQTLQNALRHSRIVHAYLFSGPRGTGKTSTARILAKAVNCLSDADDKPCNECRMCRAIDEGRAMDLIEIDAASYTGVDHIRELRDKISFSPTEAKYKFYIVDEVHMLSPSAFNALLKTLEEPPAHAILVLATTEVHKIPATVLSRCQRFDFRRIPLNAMIDRLTQIANEEGLQVEEGVLDLIARQSTGSMRDAESLLDQLASYGGPEVTMQQAQAILGTASSHLVSALVGHLSSGYVAGGLSAIGEAVAEGTDPRQLSKDLLEYLRGLLLVKTTGQAPSELTREQQREMEGQVKGLSLDTLVKAIKNFNQASLDLKNSTQPQLPLELAFVESAMANPEGESIRGAAAPPPETAPSKSSETVSYARQGSPAATSSKEAPPVQQELGQDRTPPKVEPTSSGSDDQAVTGLDGLRNAWAEVIAVINGKNMHTAALARGCLPVACEDEVITLQVQSPFHKEKLESARARQILEEAIGEISGRTYRVRCVLKGDVVGGSSNAADLGRLSEDPVVRAGLELGGEIGSVQKGLP